MVLRPDKEMGEHLALGDNRAFIAVVEQSMFKEIKLKSCPYLCKFTFWL